MSIFDKYPYTNFHEMNDDWIIKTLREFGQRLDEFVALNSLTYADPIEYDPESTYAANTVVIYDNTAYVSKQPIPAGMLPTNDEYWLMIFPFGDLIEQGVNVGLRQIDDYLQQAQDQITAAINTLPTVVNDWMVANPDVTTTVQDASISWLKLNDNLRSVMLAGYDETTLNTIDDFEQGAIDISTGANTASSFMCRTTGFLQFPDEIVMIRTMPDYRIQVFQYALDGTYEARILPLVQSTFYPFITDANHKYRVTISYDNFATLTPADLPIVPVYYYMLSSRYANKTELPVLRMPITLVRENGYRKSDGTIFGTTTQYFHSTFNAQRGDIIILDYVECATSVSVFGYFIEGTYVSRKMGEGGTAVKHLESAPLPADCVVSISGRGADFENTAVQIVRANGDIIKYITAFAKPIIDADEVVQWQYALDSVLCIGDSLTVGVPANTNTMPNPMRQNYPYYLARMIDTVCTNAGVPGIKTSEWYLEQYSNYAMTDYNAVIIFLGTNGQLTDTLETDVEPYEDYNDYATTETGYYCKLIEHILADNGNIIIVLVNVWRVNTGGDTARTVIEKIGQRYSVPVVDTYDLRYDVHPEYHGGSNNVHMAKAGYLALANRIQHALKLYLSEHVNDVNKGMTRQS